MFQCEPGAAQPSVPGPGTTQAPMSPGSFCLFPGGNVSIGAGGIFNTEARMATKDCS